MLHHTNLKFQEELKLRNRTDYIVLHHSEVISHHTVKEVHQWHLNKKWAGIGYHYFIDKEGEIYECRPIDTMGAHAYGYNDQSIGICYEGNFNKEKMSPKQEDSAVMLIALLNLAYDDSSIVKHCDLVKDKTCPGKYFPFDSLMKKIEICTKNLESLFGSQISEWILDYEARIRYQGIDEEANRKRQSMDSLVSIGNFNYSLILDLFKKIHEYD